MTASHLVGRQGELAELELAFREATSGRPGVILLGGDSGVGKTRLVAELTDSEAVAGALVLRGECLEQGEGELPYAPILGALRPLVRGKDPALDTISPSSRSHLAVLLPSLGASVAGLGSGAAEGTGQLQLFEALLELIETLSTRAPLILVLEDIHWADSSTRAFIAFLARSLRRERVLLLLTYRTDELHRRHPLRPLLTELDRVERTRRIGLSPLDRAELAEVLADLLGSAADETLLDRLLMRSEGNPLYVEELLAAGLDGRGAPPQSLNDAFMLRIEKLSPEARAAARAVAVGGRVDEPMLAALTGIDGDALHETLRAAIAENVLLAGDDDRYRFRHALLREAVYDDLLPGERGELHLATALALEAHEPPACIEDEVERVAQIATHYAAAGDQPAALRATIAAAKSARRVHAYADVAELLERALELWPRVADAEVISGTQQLELLAETASVQGMAGDWPRAEALQLRALELAGDDARVRSRLLSGLSQTQWKLNRGREGLETAQQALKLMMTVEETDADRAELLAFLARTRVLRGQFRAAITDGERALVLANAAGDRCTVGQVLNTLGMARIAIGEVSEGEAQLREAMEVAREVSDADALAVAVCNLGDLLALAGRTREALDVIKDGIATTPQTLRRTFSWMRLTLTILAFEVGDWELARSDQGPARSGLNGVALIFRHTRDAELALGFGDEEAAEAALAEAEPLVRVNSEAQWHGLYGSLLAELRRRQGDLAAARTAVMRALDELEVCTEDVMRIARVTAVGMAVEADHALRARDLRDADAEHEAMTRAGIHLDRLEAAASDGGPVEQAWLAVGQAESARAAGRSKPALWASAAAAFDALERPYPAATARWRQAEALVEADERDAATEVVRAALAVAQELGAGWLEAELGALCARARLQVEARPTRADATAEPETETPFGLTPRELQVLSLIADGATNRQIGAALFMAEKTASVHVSRILAKLGVQSRTQAAAVAHRLHLPALAEPSSL
jgi:ATP/maltotriose-dependent transcriptional regulator MalT